MQYSLKEAHARRSEHAGLQWPALLGATAQKGQLCDMGTSVMKPAGQKVSFLLGLLSRFSNQVFAELRSYWICWQGMWERILYWNSV